MMARRRAVLLGGILAAALVFVAGLVFWERFSTAPDRSAVRAAIEAASESLRSPGLTVETAAAQLETAEAARRFVEDQVQEANYAGALFAPDDVLALRTGSLVDKSRLLAALINAQGGSVQVVSGTGSADISTSVPSLPPLPDSFGALIELLRLDKEAIAKARLEALGALTKEQAAEVEQANRLLTQAWGSDESQEPAAAEDAIWVAGTDATGEAFGDGDGTPLALSQAEFNVRLVGIGRGGSRHVLLEHSGPISLESAISFQPLVAPPDAFGRELDPASVAAWVPVLAMGDEIISGRPFTPTGQVPPAAEGGLPPFEFPGEAASNEEVPELANLAIHDLDASAWPELRLSLSADLPEGADWSPDLISLTDGDTPLRPRITGFPTREQRAVIVLVDASASMAEGGRVFAAQRLVQQILTALPSGTIFSVAALAGSELRVTGETRELTSDRSEAAEAVDATFVLDSALPLSTGIASALGLADGMADLVFVGDGALQKTGRKEIGEHLTARSARLFAISIDASADAYSEVGEAFRWDSENDPEPIIRSMLRARAPFVEFAWNGPATAAGELRNVRVTATNGRGGAIDTNYIVPNSGKQPDTDVGALTLELTVPGRSGPVNLSRELIQLGAGRSPWQLEMQARLVISPGPSPDATLVRSYLDAWLDLAAAQSAAADGTALPKTVTRPSFASLQRIAGLWALAEFAAGGPLAASDPIILLERIDAHAGVEGVVGLRRTIDVLYDGLLHPEMAGRPNWLAGLALGAAEAALIGGESVNNSLLAASDLAMIAPTDALPSWTNSDLRELAESPNYSFGLSEASPQTAWVVGPDRRLEARLFDPPAKGSSVQETAAVFAGLRSRLELLSIFSGAAGSVAGLSGVPHGGVIGILDQNLRMWCFSSIMMGYVGDHIAGLPTPGDGDPDAWRRDARALCELADTEGLARAYATALGSGLISGYAGDVLSALSERALSQAFSRAINSGETFGVSSFWNSVLSLAGIGPALNEILSPGQVTPK